MSELAGMAKGDVVDIVYLDGRRTRHLVMDETPRPGGVVEYQLLSDPDNDEGPPASHEG